MPYLILDIGTIGIVVGICFILCSLHDKSLMQLLNMIKCRLKGKSSLKGVVMDTKLDYGSEPYQQELAMTTQPKQFWLAFVLNFFLPGAGHLYAGRNQTGAILLIANVISWSLTFIYIGFVGVLITWVWALVDSDAVVKAYNSALAEKKQQYQERVREEEEERAKSEQEKKETVMTSKDILDALNKANKLYSSEIITQAEFVERKATIIGELQFKKVEGDPDDLLLAIVPLVNSGVISQEEVKAIKEVLYRAI